MLPEILRVILTVINSLGQRVAALIDGVQDAGPYETRVEGSGLASGMYF